MLLASIFPAITPCIPAIKSACARYDISTLNRQSAFIAQCGYESAGFARFSENLNYSAQGLLQTFPKHFTAAQAASYARDPRRIANRVYASRMGNGDEASGDGWKFRGRGALQITGKENYTLLAQALEMSLDDTVAYLGTDEGALAASGWFWATRNLNELADKGDIPTITRIINGGEKGLLDRVALYNRVHLELGRAGLL